MQNGGVSEPRSLVPRCGAKLKSGAGTCKHEAGWGTPHSGIGACKLHGGNMPNHLLAAASHEARVLGNVIEIEPVEALLYCVRRAAGDVAYYESKIAALEETAAIGAPTSSVTTSERSGGEEKVSERQHEHTVEAHIWIRLRDQALERLARFAKMAIDAGIEERRVRNAERAGDLLAALAEAMFEALGTAPKDRARVLPIVEGRLLQLEQRPGEAA